MGIIKEPLDVDFTVNPRPLTEADNKAISDFIKASKEAKLLSKKRKASKKREKAD